MIESCITVFLLLFYFLYTWTDKWTGQRKKEPMDTHCLAFSLTHVHSLTRPWGWIKAIKQITQVAFLSICVTEREREEEKEKREKREGPPRVSMVISWAQLKQCIHVPWPLAVPFWLLLALAVVVTGWKKCYTLHVLFTLLFLLT